MQVYKHVQLYDSNNFNLQMPIIPISLPADLTKSYIEDSGAKISIRDQVSQV